MIGGGCHCGRTRYRLTVEPFFVNCCHCRDCQKLGGSAFALNAMVEADNVELLSGVADDENDEEMRCSSCGTLLWAYHRMFRETVRFVRVGTLDEGERFPPDAHFFVPSRHPWISIPEGVPQFETMPAAGDQDLFPAEAKARIAAAKC